VFYKKGDLDKATYYYKKSLAIAEEINGRAEIGTVLCNLGGVYLDQKNYDKALEATTRSLKLNMEIASLEKIKNSALTMNKIYKATGNYEKALQNYHLYIKMRDSLNNEEIKKASIRSLYKYEYEKKAAADSVSHAKESELKNMVIEKKEAQLDGERKTQYVLYGGLSLVMVFAGFMFNRFKITQKQKAIIELKEKEAQQQKHTIEEKQKEILDSINYARRIQTAHMPTNKYIEKNIERLKK
jgi:tetratricopeptide (TPR) repeat protein